MTRFSSIVMLLAIATSATAQSSYQARVVNRVADELERGYVFPDIGAAMARQARARLAAGAYDSLSDPTTFARALSTDLRSVSHDGHLRIVTRLAPPTGGNNTPS